MRPIALLALCTCWSGYSAPEQPARVTRLPRQMIPCTRLTELFGELPEVPDVGECDDEDSDRFYWCRWTLADQDASSLRNWANNAIAWCLP